MKRTFLLLLTITSLLFATSCTTSDEEADTMLQLSETELSFSNEAGEETIIVSTDEENWSVIGSANWLDAVRNGNTFTITVKENKTTEARTGKIMVVAGKANAMVYIEQKAAKTYANIDNGVLGVNSHANKYVIDVDANSKEWDVTTDDDWFTVTPKPYKGELLIQVTENEDRVERTGKIILNIGGKLNKEIIIKQDGMMFFILPYAVIGDGIKEIKKFEKARGSELFMQPEGQNRYFWGFRTESELFSEIHYGIDGNKYVLSKVFIASRAVFDSEYANFMVYMEEKGFVEDTDGTFFSEELELKATIKLASLKPHILYQYAPKQVKPYPTFTKFPYGYTSWGMGKANIDKHEAENGGTLNDKASHIDNDPRYDFLYYDVVSNNDEAPQTRTYFVFKNEDLGYKVGLGQTAQYFYDNINLIAFQGKDGFFYLTAEFKALCEKEGFVFVGINPNGYIEYKNEKKQLGIRVFATIFDGDTQPSADLRVYTLDKATSGSYATTVEDAMPKKHLKKFGL